MIPKVSIVTPSMNQVEYLESTIKSLLDQECQNLEYIVIDGGSDDGSVDIIRKYEHKLTFWSSEPDKGQYDAINKGFSRSTGEIMGWLNSDDMHLPWTLSVVGEIFAHFPDVEWITTMYPLIWDSQCRVVNADLFPEVDLQGFLNGECLPSPKWHGRAFVQQESTFWRRRLWDKAGGALNTDYPLAADLDLWARFFKHADLVRVATPLAGFRMHSGQKTDVQFNQYLDDADRVLVEHGGQPYSPMELFLKRKVFPSLSWRSRRLMGWCGGNPRFYRVCRCDLRGAGWGVDQIWA